MKDMELQSLIRAQIVKNMPQKQGIGPAPGGLGAEGAGPPPPVPMDTSEQPNEAMEGAPEAMEPPGQPEPTGPFPAFDKAANAAGMAALRGGMAGLSGMGKMAGKAMGAATSAMLPPAYMKEADRVPGGAEEMFKSQMGQADQFSADHAANMARHQQAAAEFAAQQAHGGPTSAAVMEQVKQLMNSGVSPEQLQQLMADQQDQIQAMQPDPNMDPENAQRAALAKTMMQRGVGGN